MGHTMQAVTGMKDVLPGEVEKMLALESLARTLFTRYGYREIRTPILESADLFRRGTGETTDMVEKEMYTLTDAGDKELALRPEGTPPVARAVLEHGMNKQSSLVKLMYVGPLFRRERPQAGRYRQFFTIGVEALGQASPWVDVEQLEMMHRFLALAGVRGTELHVNNIGCGLCRPGYREALKAYAQPRVERLCGNCRRRLERNPLRLLDCKVETCRQEMAEAPVMAAHWCEACRNHFAQVQAGLKRLGVPYVLAPRLVRGIDYYTRTVFECVEPGRGAQNALVSGGRYDDLVETLGGDPWPAVGFGVGVERVLEHVARLGASEPVTQSPDVYVAAMGGEAVERAVPLAAMLRVNGFSVEMNFEAAKSLKAQMRQANQSGAQAVMLLGERELASQSATLKWLETGSQEEVKWEHLASKLREGLK